MCTQCRKSGTEIGEIKNGSLAVATTNAVEARELTLKVMEGAQARIFFLDVIEGAGEEVVDFGLGALRFGDFFDHRRKVRGDEGIGIMQAELWSIRQNGALAEGVKVPRFAGGPGNFCGEKKIDLPGKTAGAAACTFRDGIDEPVLESPPADDGAGVS